MSPPEERVVDLEPTLAAALVEALKDLTVVEAARTAKIPMKSGGEFCLDPSTPVLTADLNWIAVGDLTVGDELVGFDEDPPGFNRARRWKKSRVEAVSAVRLPAYLLTLEDGTEFVASSSHRWLVRRGQGTGKKAWWCDTSDLPHWARLLRVVRRWGYEADWTSGYLAAAFDGEGHLTQTSTTPGSGGGTRFQCHLGFSQRENVMLETVDKLAGAKGFVLGDYALKGSTVRTRRILGGRGEVLRFLGSVRPNRLLSKLDIDRLGDMRTIEEVGIESLEPWGHCDLTALKTSTGTFIAEGFATHNSYKYADIGDVVRLTRPKLAEHGIIALTPIIEHGDGLACMVTLLHSSGDRMDLGPFPFPHGRDAQATGSSVTYHRRYALVAALGMAAGDDDDGATAKPRAPLDEPPGNVPPRRGGPPVCVVCGEEIVGKVKKHGSGWVHDPLCEKPADNPETEPF